MTAGRRRAHVEGLDRLARQRRLARRRHQEERRNPLQHGQRQVAADAVAQHEPAAAPVVGDEPDALGARGADRGEAGRAAVDLDHAEPASRPGGAVEGGQKLGPSRAHDAGEPDDLAGPHLERNLDRRLPAGADAAGREAGPFEPQHRLAEIGAALRIELGERAPDQHPHEFRLGGLRRRNARHLAVAQHGDAVGDARHLLEPVGDVDDPDAAGGDLAHDQEEPVDLGRGQGRGRLVHDEDPRRVGQRLGDGDHLPAADRKLADRLVDVDVGPDRGEALARGVPHRAAVEHARRGSVPGRGTDWP